MISALFIVFRIKSLYFNFELVRSFLFFVFFYFIFFFIQSIHCVETAWMDLIVFHPDCMTTPSQLVLKYQRLYTDRLITFDDIITHGYLPPDTQYPTESLLMKPLMYLIMSSVSDLARIMYTTKKTKTKYYKLSISSLSKFHASCIIFLKEICWVCLFRNFMTFYWCWVVWFMINASDICNRFSYFCDIVFLRYL